MKKKYQVFVSSTYKDLIEERYAVMRVLLDNDCIPIGMEQFPASDMSQMAYIEKMLEDCDYYILILAGKYGSVAQNTSFINVLNIKVRICSHCDLVHRPGMR